MTARQDVAHSARAEYTLSAGSRMREEEKVGGKKREKERERVSQLLKVKVVHFKSPAEILLVLTQYLSKHVKINFLNEALIMFTLGTIPS